jgi:NADPH-dependent glutamate synthase beta subunit-like oxidoreductase
MNLKGELSVLKIDADFINSLEEIDKTYRSKKISTDYLLFLAIKLQDFLIKKFDIIAAFNKIKQEIISKENIFFHRQNFIQRYIFKKYNESSLLEVDFIDNIYTDEEFCILLETSQNKDFLEQYAAWACFSKQGKIAHKNSKLFNPPSKINFNFEYKNGTAKALDGYKTNRSNFNLSTQAPTISQISVEANYCLYCHERAKDTCRTGFKKETILPNGCPMDQKISEMNLLAKTGDVLAAIAIAMIDNPFLLLTGNRICNDCIKGCIFQNQTAIDVPSIESGLVDLLLKLPFGFEIYALLMEWNPLKSDFAPSKPINKKVLVVGLGPAGISLSYYFLRAGWQVHAIDSMPIANLETDPNIVYDNFSKSIIRPLENRKDIGFGGVMEHGITSRWDKNFLTAMHIILKRNPRFSCSGNVEFDKNIDIKIAETQGYNYIALASGSGDAKLPPILQNNIPNGVYNSKDFLIQINTDSKSVDFIHQPVVVLGSGLTAIDCAAEAMVCLKKTQQNPSVTIVSRGNLVQSVAYQTNHEEIKFAMENDVVWLENFEAQEFITKNNNIIGIKDKNNQILAAKTIIIAIGTHNKEYKILDPQKDQFCIAKTDKLSVGIFGDLHPKYRGTVVKALASGKQMYLANLLPR